MTRKTGLPSHEEVRNASAELVAEAHASGTRPTVVALARRLGLTNPTFWRHFPGTAREIANLGRTPTTTTPTPDGATTNRLLELEKRNAELRRANQTLTEHLAIAVANIQRLALDNHRLRQQIEAAANVTHLKPRITQRLIREDGAAWNRHPTDQGKA